MEIEKNFHIRVDRVSKSSSVRVSHDIGYFKKNTPSIKTGILGGNRMHLLTVKVIHLLNLLILYKLV